MRIATHPPLYLPWPGLFFKGLESDCLVLLDQVQFPRGASWVSRNRIKGPAGTLWLSVPVHRKGRGLQIIREVEIFTGTGWRRKHLRSIRQNYARAPYLEDYFPLLESIYRIEQVELASLNVDLIRLFWELLGLPASLRLQSDLQVQGRGTDLIVALCRRLEATSYLNFPMAREYLDANQFAQAGVDLVLKPFSPPIYPQLWGEFLPNLSVLDLLLNCGPKSLKILGQC